MNITNATTENITGDKLIAIFDRQKELMNKYHDIEKNIGLMQTEDCPVNLHDKRGQARLKDFAWRATEEVAEAMETIPTLNELFEKLSLLRIRDFATEMEFVTTHRELCDSVNDNVLHFQEELVDALHFFTEFTILCDITPNRLWELLSKDNWELKEGGDILNLLFNKANKDIAGMSLEAAMSGFIIDLGLSCNCLKNKAWKQSQMLTDIPKFNKSVANAWISFMRLLHAGKLNPNTIVDLYLKKSQVNAFRQTSLY